MELKLSLEEEFKIIEKNFKNKSGSNYAASRGEYLNGLIMAAYLKCEFIDAADVIFFDEEGNFDSPHREDRIFVKDGSSHIGQLP